MSGGATALGVLLPDGGRYNPATDTWTAIPETLPNSPAGRLFSQAMWTGTEMIVWGGYHFPGGDLEGRSDGGRYNPATNTWTPITPTEIPGDQPGPQGGWTGTGLVAWSGSEGARYDDGSGLWAAMSTVSAPLGGVINRGWTWSGTELLLFGGEMTGSYFNTGYRYNSTIDSWFALPVTAETPTPRTAPSALWTGTEAIFWSGVDGGGYLSSGSLYNPATAIWTEMTTTDAPSGRRHAVSLWTGTKAFFCGGSDTALRDDGGLYDPDTDTWTPISTVNSPAGATQGVWTGTEALVVATSGTRLQLHRYDPATDAWTLASTMGAPPHTRLPRTWCGPERSCLSGGGMSATEWVA